MRLKQTSFVTSGKQDSGSHEEDKEPWWHCHQPNMLKVSYPLAMEPDLRHCTTAASLVLFWPPPIQISSLRAPLRHELSETTAGPSLIVTCSSEGRNYEKKNAEGCVAIAAVL